MLYVKLHFYKSPLINSRLNQSNMQLFEKIYSKVWKKMLAKMNKSNKAVIKSKVTLFLILVVTKEMVLTESKVSSN